MKSKTVNLSVLVEVDWDDEAGVWVAMSDDVPGLTAEHSDFRALQNMVIELIPILLVENDMLDGLTGDQEVPVHIAAKALARNHALVHA